MSRVTTAMERALQGTVLGISALLACRCIGDVIWNGHRFPFWFPPLFALGTVVLLALAAFMITRPPQASPSASETRAVFIALVLSFPCVTAVHGFVPFTFDTATIAGWRPSLRFNLMLAGLGVVGALAAGALDRLGRRKSARIVLLILALVLLLPNDDCDNPFNAWWIQSIGASPLMYLPNALAILFGGAALRGIRPLTNILVIIGICASTLLLGLGHQAGIIW